MSVANYGQRPAQAWTPGDAPLHRQSRPSAPSSPRGSSRLRPRPRARRPSGPTPTRSGRCVPVPRRAGHARGRRRRRAPSTSAGSCSPRSSARRPSSAAVHFRNLRVFFGWLVREERARRSEPDGSRGNAEGHQEGQGVLRRRGTSRLLKTCAGPTFVDRRDTAIMRILIDTGHARVRPGGPAIRPRRRRQNDVFLTQRRLRIRLKGGDETWVPIGKKAAAALDKYIRARARHAHASSPWLWLGVQGHNTAHMTDSRHPRHGRATGRPSGDPERPPAPLPPILRRQVASGRWFHRRPHAHHGMEDLRHGPRVHRGARHRPSPQRPRSPQPWRPHLSAWLVVGRPAVQIRELRPDA